MRPHIRVVRTASKTRTHVKALLKSCLAARTTRALALPVRRQEAKTKTSLKALLESRSHWASWLLTDGAPREHARRSLPSVLGPKVQIQIVPASGAQSFVRTCLAHNTSPRARADIHKSHLDERAEEEEAEGADRYYQLRHWQASPGIMSGHRRDR